MIEPGSELFSFLFSSGKPDIDVVRVCMERKWAIPTFYPPLFVPIMARQNEQTYDHIKSMGNVNGLTFLIQV